MGLSVHRANKYRQPTIRLPPPKPTYAACKQLDMAIAIVFFSPVGWKLPRQHYHTVVDDCESAGYPVYTLELTGIDNKVRSTGNRKIIKSDHVMFHKENLQNILEDQFIPQKFQKILFLDADVYFSNPHWYSDASAELEQSDLLQPYSRAIWVDQLGSVHSTSTQGSKESSASAISRGDVPSLGITHPGFAWAFRRPFFKRIKGFFDQHLAGGGDSAFISALREGPTAPSLDKDFAFKKSAAFQRYAAQLRWQDPVVSFVAGEAVHMYHGPFDRRQYHDRCDYLPTVDSKSGNYPVHYREDGLLEWDSDLYSDRMRMYFQQREEDA